MLVALHLPQVETGFSVELRGLRGLRGIFLRPRQLCTWKGEDLRQHEGVIITPHLEKAANCRYIFLSSFLLLTDYRCQLFYYFL